MSSVKYSALNEQRFWPMYFCRLVIHKRCFFFFFSQSFKNKSGQDLRWKLGLQMQVLFGGCSGVRLHPYSLPIRQFLNVRGYFSYLRLKFVGLSLNSWLKEHYSNSRVCGSGLRAKTHKALLQAFPCVHRSRIIIPNYYLQ